MRDTGPGLPADIIDTLFTPFVTTKAHGLGIGLTIVRTIVDAHGGTIVARNNPEGGATFTVTLRRSESAAFVAGALPQVDQESKPPVVVAVVEDDVPVAHVICSTNCRQV